MVARGFLTSLLSKLVHSALEPKKKDSVQANAPKDKNAAKCKRIYGNTTTSEKGK